MEIWAALAGGGVALGISYLLFRARCAALRASREHAERLKAAQDELRRLNERLGASNAALSDARDEALELAYRAQVAERTRADFVTAVSHELRTPLHILLGAIELMDADPREEARRDYARTARGSALQLLGLVDDILEATCRDPESKPPKWRAYDLHALLSDVVARYEPRAAELRLQLASIIDADVPKQVHGHPRTVARVLHALLDNALRFTPRGSVQLHAHRAGARVRIAIADTGVGIAPEQVERLFEPFVRPSASVDGVEGWRPGVGLGLPVASRLTRRIGAQLTLTSRVGVGSRFELEFDVLPPDDSEEGVSLSVDALPSSDFVQAYARGAADATDAVDVAVAIEAATEARSPAPAPQPATAARILVVDDNPVNRKVAAGMVERIGYSVATAEDGRDALGRLNEARFDLVFMDCQMPVMDGYDAARSIRAGLGGDRHRHVPVVALTAGRLEGDRERCLAAGMNGYLPKPASRAQLEAVLDRWLSARPRPA